MPQATAFTRLKPFGEKDRPHSTHPASNQLIPSTIHKGITLAGRLLTSHGNRIHLTCSSCNRTIITKKKLLPQATAFSPFKPFEEKNGLKSQLSAALEPLKDLLIFFFFFFRLLTDTSLGCAKLRCLDSGASGTARAAPQQLGYLSKPICTMAPLTPTLIPRTHPPNAGSLDEAAREHTGRLDATKENSCLLYTSDACRRS